MCLKCKQTCSNFEKLVSRYPFNLNQGIIGMSHALSIFGLVNDDLPMIHWFKLKGECDHSFGLIEANNCMCAIAQLERMIMGNLL